MQTDELRGELAELAREVDEFPEDLGRIRRRVARRRALVGSTAIVVAIALVAGAIALAGSSPSHVNITGTEKQIAVAKLPRVDAVVVLPAHATDADAVHVRRTLGSTAAVEKYAALPVNTLASLLGLDSSPAAKSLHARVCAAPSTRSYAIELVRTGPDPLQELKTAIGQDATVRSIGKPDVDVEVFMEVHATGPQTAAIQARIRLDPDVESFRFLTHEDAFREFKRLFADQHVLIEHTTASSLPESFRLVVREGISDEAVARRYRGAAGVQSVIAASTDWANFAHFPLTEACAR